MLTILFSVGNDYMRLRASMGDGKNTVEKRV